MLRRSAASSARCGEWLFVEHPCPLYCSGRAGLWFRDVSAVGVGGA